MIPNGVMSSRALRIALVATLYAGQVAQTWAAAPYFRLVVGAQGNSGTGTGGNQPPAADPNAVRGDGDLAIYAPLQVRARPGIPFKLAFFVENGEGAIAWSSVGSEPPPGLALGADGVIAGMPAGVSSVSGLKVQGIDAATKQGVTKPFQIDSLPLPVVTVAPALTEALKGKALTIKPTASNVFGSQTWRAIGALPGGLSLDDKTGEIKGAPAGRGEYRGLKLAVVDGDGAPGESNPFDIVVTQSLDMKGLKGDYLARVGRTFPAVAPIVTGGKGALAWSTTPALPAGITIDPATGRITGGATAPAEIEGLVVKAEDRQTGEVATSDPIKLTAAGNPTVTLDAVLHEGRVGTDLKVEPTAESILKDGYWTLRGGLPEGLKIDTASGALSGKPAVAGRASALRFQVTDLFDGMQAASPDFALQIHPKLELGAALPPAAKVGAAFVMRPPVVDGLVGTASWELSGTLPDGLSFDPATGEVKGTPTKDGRTPGFVYIVTDSQDKATAKSASFAIDVLDPSAELAFAVNPLATRYPAPIGKIFSLKPAATGAKATVTWEAKTPLPRWATLNIGSGEVSGLPDEIKTYEELVLVARDGASGPVAESTAFAIEVKPGSDTLSLAYAATTTVLADDAMEDLVPTVSGATSDAKYSLTSGPLPDGVTLEAGTGKIKGTPTLAGNFPGLVVTLRDGKDGELGTISNEFALTVKAGRKARMSDISVAPGFDAYGAAVAENMAAPVTWSLSVGTLPSWARLAAATGVISGRPEAVGSTKGLVLTAKDANGKVARTDPFAIDVVEKAVLDVAVKGVDGVWGEALTPVAQKSTGAVGAVKWYLAGLGQDSGGLPAGVMVDEATGAFVGTPTEVGTFAKIYLQAVDEGGSRVLSEPVTVTIKRPELKPELTQAEIQIHLGDSVLSATPGIEGAMGAVRWSAGTAALPDGVGFEPASGVLAGLPTGLGKWGPFLLTATDIDGESKPVAAGFSIEVLDIPVVDPIGEPDADNPTATAGVVRGKVGQPLGTPAPTARNIVGTPAWTLAAGTLPDGITVDGGTGKLTGTPKDAAVVNGLAVTVTDATGASATSPPFRLVVDDEIVLEVTLAKTEYEGVVGQSLTTAAPSVKNATGTVTWTRASGSPPPGTSVNAAGQITGTPTNFGLYKVVLRGTDTKNKAQVTPELAITVARPLTVTSATPPEGRVGRDYALALSVPEKRGALTFTATGLPAGLSVDAGGKVVGKPTAAGTFTAEVKVKDATDFGDGKGNVTIKVLPEIKVTGVKTVVPAHEKSPMTSPVLGFTGVIGQPEWSPGDNLPAWATLNKDIGTFSGTPPTATTVSGVTLKLKDGHDGWSGTSDPFQIQVLPELNVVNMATSYSARYGFPFKAEKPTLLHAFGDVKWAWADASRVPSWLKLDPVTGEMTGTPDAAVASAGLMLWGSDETNVRAPSVPFTLNVYSQLTVSVDTKDVKVRVGDAVAVKGTVVGTVGTAGWSLGSVTGTLPAGLAITAATGKTGTFGGTATGVGLADLTLRATDDHDNAAGVSDTVHVEANPVIVVSGMKPAYSGRVGVFMDFETPQAANVLGERQWTITPRPSGLDFDEFTGHLSGIPTVKQADAKTTLTVTDDHDAASGKAEFQVEILDRLAITGAGNLNARTNVEIGPVSFTPTAAPARGAIAWSLADGSGPLPNGVSVDPATGKLRGKPTGYATTQAFPGLFLKAKDVDTEAETLTPFSVTVRPNFLASTTQTALAADTGDAKTMAKPNPVGGVGTVTWEIVTLAGTPPANAAIDKTTGIVTFTADAGSVGTWGYVLRATDDADGAKADAGPVTVTISQKPTLVYDNVTVRLNADLGVQNILPKTVLGLKAPLSYTWTTKPTGGTIVQGTGKLGGTITGATATAGSTGTVNSTVTVTDSASPARSATTSGLTITVAPAPTASWKVNLRKGVTSVVQPNALANLLGPTAYSLQGVLPAWPIAIDAANGAITATPSDTSCGMSGSGNSWQVKLVDGPDNATALTTTAKLTCQVAGGPLAIATNYTKTLDFVVGTNGSVALGYENLVTPTSGVGVNVPAGLTVDNLIRITGTPAVGSAREQPYEVKVSTTDGFDGATAEATVLVRVMEKATLVGTSNVALAQQTSNQPGACTGIPFRNTGGWTAYGLAPKITGNADAYQLCTAPTNPCGDTLAAGASCNVGVQVNTTVETVNNGTVSVSGSNFSQASATFTGSRKFSLASGSKLFLVNEVWTPPAPNLKARAYVVNGGGSGYTATNPADDFGRVVGEGGNAGFTAYGDVVVPGTVQVTVGKGGVSTLVNGEWTAALGEQSSLGNLIAAPAPARYAGGTAGGNHWVNVFFADTTSKIVTPTSGSTNGAANTTLSTKTSYSTGQGATLLPPAGYFNKSTYSFSAGAGGGVSGGSSPTKGCGSATPPKVAGSGGAGGIKINGLAAVAAGNGSGSNYGLGGTWFGAGGGGHYVENCAVSSSFSPGAGYAGFVYVEWDAQ